MADSSFVGANVVIATDKFSDIVTRLNQALYALSTTVVTSKANTVGATTVGNVNINGVHAANVLTAIDGLRGGTVSTSANLSITSNAVFGANAFFNGAVLVSNSAQIDGTLLANGAVNVRGAVTINSSMTALTANVQGAKNFGSANSITFSEQGNTSYRGKVLTINNSDLLDWVTITFAGLSGVSVPSPSDGDVLTYVAANSTWVSAAKAVGGSFAANTLVGNNITGVYRIMLGDLTTIGETGYVANLIINTTSNTSILTLGGDALTVNATVFTLGNISKLRIAGGSNSQFLQLKDTTNGNVQFTTVDKDLIFPASAVTTVGANVLSIDRTNSRLGIGTNSVSASYVLGIVGNMQQTGDQQITGNVTISGTISGGAYSGLPVANATTSGILQVLDSVTNTSISIAASANSVKTAYDRATSALNASGVTSVNTRTGAVTITASDINGLALALTSAITSAGNITPTSNTVNLGNTIQRWVLVANTGNFSGAVSITGDLTESGNVMPAANGTQALGNTLMRWIVNANTADIASTLTVGGIATLSANVMPAANGTQSLGNTLMRWIVNANTADIASTLTVSGVSTFGANVMPNANGTLQLGNTLMRWILKANTVDIASTLTVTGVSTLSANLMPNANGTQNFGNTLMRWIVAANTLDVASTVTLGGVTTTSANIMPTSNTINFGNSVARWIMFANTIDIQGTSQHTGVATFSANISIGSDAFYSTIPNGSANSVGLRNAIPNNQNAAYTFTKADNGQMVRFSNTTGNTYTIANNATTAYDLGHVTIVRNINSGVLKIARGTGVTLRIAGSATNADANVSQWGYASICQEATDTWVISGANVA